MEPNDARKSLLVDSLRAHALQFERPRVPGYGEATGLRMLAAFLAVGVGLFLLLRLGIEAAGMPGLPMTNLAFVLALLVAFFGTQRFFVGRPASEVGLRPLAAWTRRERLYALQVVPLVMVGFAIVFRGHLLALIERHGVPGFVLFSVLTGLAWGMTQEVIYRGWLQTELTRRFGAVTGIVAANAVFTFGPLHFDHLLAPDGVRWAGLAAVFGIGLFFGILFHRSGNLWLPAILHGLWPLNMA